MNSRVLLAAEGIAGGNRARGRQPGLMEISLDLLATLTGYPDT